MSHRLRKEVPFAPLENKTVDVVSNGVASLGKLMWVDGSTPSFGVVRGWYCFVPHVGKFAKTAHCTVGRHHDYPPRKRKSSAGGSLR